MTKTVRIENADMAPYRVKIEIQDRRELPRTTPDDEARYEWVTVTSETKFLNHPTAMEAPYLTSTRRIIISEVA